jgi:hypothetical protein
VGQQGLVKLHYSGAYKGKFKGAVTCTVYEFSPELHTRYVDKRDAPAILAMQINDENVFTAV